MLLTFLTALAAGSTLVGAYPTEDYDYVIIGSGPGGGSLAANLALSGASVFLIEAGGDGSQDIVQQIPALAGRAAENAPNSWQFFVEHYSNRTQAFRDRKYTYLRNNGSYYSGVNPPSNSTPLGLLYPRGATLGGSSQVNAMNFAWAPDNEWDYIAELTGDDGWSHEAMRKHLIDLENCTYVPRGTPGHGSDGYLQNDITDAAGLEYPNVFRYVQQMFHDTGDREVENADDMRELLHRDINRIDNDRYEKNTFFIPPRAINPTTGSRSMIAEHINNVVAAGHPLTIRLHSLASKILFEECEEEKKPKAVGVEYLVGEGLYSADSRYDASQNAETRTVRAKKEVIVSGGTFNTPQILKLSGVGPRAELEEWDIPVVVDLPAVGNYMDDNYEAPVVIRSEEPFLDVGDTPCTMTFDIETDPCFAMWRNNASGPYTSIGSGFSGTYRTRSSWDNDTDIFWLSSAGYAGEGFVPGYSNFTSRPDSWATSVVKMQTGNPSGTVKLRSRDPRVAPAINFNFFSKNSDRDLNALTEAAQVLLDAATNAGFNYEVILPELANMRQSIMDNTFSHHAVSSCRMGRPSANDTCVDSKFRVHGVKNLRVVDASVFPRAPGAFANGPTFTISRKALKDILDGN